MDTLYDLNAAICSVDRSKQYYRDRRLKTGYACSELSLKKDRWTLHTGFYLPEILEQLNTRFDCLIIDTVHSLPGEVLDTLAAMNYLESVSLFIIHDYYFHFINDDNHFRFSNKVLYDAMVGDKIIPLDMPSAPELPNIAALVTNDDTEKYIMNVVGLLTMPWDYMISKYEYDLYHKFYLEHYGKMHAEYLSKGYTANKKRFDRVLPRERERQTREKTVLLKLYECEINKLGVIKTRPQFVPDGAFMYCPVTDDKRGHFEITLLQKSAEVALHFEKHRADSGLAAEIMAKSNISLECSYVENSLHCGCRYILPDKYDAAFVALTFKYLHAISRPFLEQRGMFFYS